MSQENVEIVAKLYEMLLRSPEGMADQCRGVHRSRRRGPPDPSVLGTSATYYGYEGLLRSVADVLVVFNDARFVPEKLTATGDRVVVTVT